MGIYKTLSLGYISAAHASSLMNSDGGVSGTVYHFDEEKVYIDFLGPRNVNGTGGPFCTGQFK